MKLQLYVSFTIIMHRYFNVQLDLGHWLHRKISTFLYPSQFSYVLVQQFSLGHLPNALVVALCSFFHLWQYHSDIVFDDFIFFCLIICWPCHMFANLMYLI